MTRSIGPTCAKVLDAIPELRKILRRYPTSAEVAEHLGMSLRAISSSLSRLHRNVPKRIYIAGYERRIGRSGREASQWAIGCKPDALRPRIARLQARRAHDARYRQNHVAQRRAYNRKRRGCPVNPFQQLIDHGKK